MVITSNSEKVLPEPFLRRCIYYHIEAPNTEILHKIIKNRLQQNLKSLSSAFQNRCLDFFEVLRKDPSLEKQPSTGELLSWFLIMAERQEGLTESDIGGEVWCDLASHCLLKIEKDQQRLPALVENWQKKS